MNSEKSLIFIILALGCVWLIVDNVAGNKMLNKFINMMFEVPKPIELYSDVVQNQIGNNIPVIGSIQKKFDEFYMNYLKKMGFISDKKEGE